MNSNIFSVIPKASSNHTIHYIKKTLYRTLLLLSISCSVQANNSLGGFLDFNLYPYLADVDSDNSMTINAASKLNGGFSYFSLTNFSNQSGVGELQDTTAYYTEQNIRWQVAKDSPFDLTLQMNFRSGEDNDRHRLGVRWRMNQTSQFKSFFDNLNLKYSVNLHAIQFDHENGHVWQLEHVFNLKLPSISEKLYIAGFIDHTFNQTLSADFPDNPIVGEVQIGYEVFKYFYIVGEYRVNEYRRSDVNNFAAGIQYKMVW